MEGLDDIAIKVAGALSGVVRVPSLHAKVSEFRARVAELLGTVIPSPSTIAGQCQLRPHQMQLCFVVLMYSGRSS